MFGPRLTTRTPAPCGISTRVTSGCSSAVSALVDRVQGDGGVVAVREQRVAARGAEVDAPRGSDAHSCDRTRRPRYPTARPASPAAIRATNDGLSRRSAHRRRPASSRLPATASAESSISQIHPSPYGILLIRSGASGQRVVHRGHRAGDRRVDLRHRLGRLHLAELPARLDLAAHRRQVDEDDVPERVLRVVGDPDPHARLPRRGPTRAPASSGVPRGCSWGATIPDGRPDPQLARARAASADPLHEGRRQRSDASRSDPSAQTWVTGSSGSGTTRAQPWSERTLMPSTSTSSASSSASCSIRVRMIRPFCSERCRHLLVQDRHGRRGSTTSATDVEPWLRRDTSRARAAAASKAGRNFGNTYPPRRSDGEGDAAGRRRLEQTRTARAG